MLELITEPPQNRIFPALLNDSVLNAFYIYNKFLFVGAFKIISDNIIQATVVDNETADSLNLSRVALQQWMDTLNNEMGVLTNAMSNGSNTDSIVSYIYAIQSSIAAIIANNNNLITVDDSIRHNQADSINVEVANLQVTQNIEWNEQHTVVFIVLLYL